MGISEFAFIILWFISALLTFVILPFNNMNGSDVN